MSRAHPNTGLVHLCVNRDDRLWRCLAYSWSGGVVWQWWYRHDAATCRYDRTGGWVDVTGFLIFYVPCTIYSQAVSQLSSSMLIIIIVLPVLLRSANCAARFSLLYDEPHCVDILLTCHFVIPALYCYPPQSPNMVTLCLKD